MAYIIGGFLTPAISDIQSDLDVADFLEALGQMFSVFIIDKLKKTSPRKVISIR